MGMPATEAHSVCADLRCRVYLRAGRGGCTNPLTADAGFRPAWPRAALGRYAPSSPGAVAGFDISDTGFRPVHVVGATPAAMRSALDCAHVNRPRRSMNAGGPMIFARAGLVAAGCVLTATMLSVPQALQ